MRTPGTKAPKRSESDLQSRLVFIENRLDAIREKAEENEPASALAEVAYLASYLAEILRKHLQTGEK